MKTSRAVGFAVNYVALIYVLALPWAAHHSVSAASPHVSVRPMETVVHFEDLGPAVGMAAHGSIAFKIKLAPFVRHLAATCQMSDLVYKDAHFDIKIGGGEQLVRLLDAMEAECYSHARELTQVLTAWIPEQELHGHPLLQLDHELWQEGHKSAAAPLDRPKFKRTGLNNMETAVDPDYDEEYYEDFDLTLSDDNINLDVVQLDGKTPMTKKNKNFFRHRGEGKTFSKLTEAPSEPTTEAMPEDLTAQRNATRRAPIHINRVAINRNRPRYRRFVTGLLAAAGAALGISGLAGAFSGLFHSSASESELKHVAEDINNVLNIEEEQIVRLNATLGGILENMASTAQSGHFLLGMEALQRQNNVFYQRTTELIKGLVALLHRELTPSLVRTDHLRELFESVTRKMAAFHAKPLISSPLSLFSLDVGHSIDLETLELTVEMLVPGQQTGTAMRIYRFVNFPMQMSPYGHQYGLPVVKDHYLGVRDDHSTGKIFHVLTAAEYAECKRVEGLHVCNIPNVYHRSSRARCVEQLFSQELSYNGSDLSANCQFVPVRDESFAVQSTEGRFHIFLPRMEHVTTVCGKHSMKHNPLQGLVEVYLPAGCTASTTELDLRPEIGVRSSNATITRAEFKMDNFLSQEQMDAWSSLAETRKMPPGGLTFDQAQAKVEEDTQELQAHSLLFYLAMAGLGIASTLFLGYLGSRFMKCSLCVRREEARLRRRRRRQPIYEQVELRPMSAAELGASHETDVDSRPEDA